MHTHNVLSVITDSTRHAHNITSDRFVAECLSFRTTYPLTGWYSYNWVAIAMVDFTLAPFTAVINLLVAIAILKNSTLQTVSNIIILNLTLTDMLTGFIAEPLLGTINIMASQSTMSCPIFTTASVVSYYFTTVSFLTLAFVMLDRFFAIFLPYRYVMIADKNLIIKMLVSIWIFGALILVVSGFTKKFVLHNYFTIIIIPVVFGWSFFVQVKTLILIRRIHREVSSLPTTDSDPSPQDNASSSTTRLGFFILLAMWFCFVPKASVYFLSYAFGKTSDLLHIASSWTNIAVLTNSLLNPLIYCYYLREIRGSVSIMLKGCFRRNP